MTLLPEGSLDLTLPVAGFDEVKTKTLRFDADVRVLEPKEVIQEILVHRSKARED